MNLFIVGAGFTKAICPHAPLNRDLLEVLVCRSPDSAAAVLGNRYCAKDIEIVLTRLDVDISLSDGSSGKKELCDLRQRIESEIAAYFGCLCVSEELLEQLPWLANIIDNVFSSGDIALSLNYDCVLEGALDCGGKWSAKGGYGQVLDNPVAWNDRTPVSPVVVLKIHGSANFRIAPYADKPTAAAVNFEFSERFFPHSAKHSHIGYGAETGRSYLIAPSYVKIPTVEMTYLMLEALSASSKAKNLVVIGSALRPEDSFLTLLVTNFLRQPFWSNRKMIIVDPNANRIAERLKSFWGVDVSSQIVPIVGRIEHTGARLVETLSS